MSCQLRRHEPRERPHTTGFAVFRELGGGTQFARHKSYVTPLALGILKVISYCTIRLLSQISTKKLPHSAHRREKIYSTRARTANCTEYSSQPSRLFNTALRVISYTYLDSGDSAIPIQNVRLNRTAVTRERLSGRLTAVN